METSMDRKPSNHKSQVWILWLCFTVFICTHTAKSQINTVSASLDEITDYLTSNFPVWGTIDAKEIAAKWHGSKDESQINRITSALTPIPTNQVPRYRLQALCLLFKANITSDQSKGDLLAKLLANSEDSVQRGFLYSLSWSYVSSSASLRQVFFNDLEDFKLIGHPAIGECEAAIRAFNCLQAWLQDTGVIDPEKSDGMSPHCLPEFRDPQIAQLKKLIVGKGLISLEVKPPTTTPSLSVSLPLIEDKQSESAKPTVSSPSEESTSSTPWSLIVILIVAATGLLWLLVKKRK